MYKDKRRERRYCEKKGERGGRERRWLMKHERRENKGRVREMI